MQPAQLEVTARRNWSQDFDPNCPPLSLYSLVGKTEGRRKLEWQRLKWLDTLFTQRTWVWANLWGNSEGQGCSGMLQSMGLQNQTWLKSWTTAYITGMAWSLNRSAWENGAASTWTSEPEWLLKFLLCGLNKHSSQEQHFISLSRRVSRGFYFHQRTRRMKWESLVSCFLSPPCSSIGLRLPCFWRKMKILYFSDDWTFSWQWSVCRYRAWASRDETDGIWVLVVIR